MYIEKVFKEKQIGKEYEIKGWVYRIRKMKDKVFIVVRDSYGIIQTVFDANSPHFNDADKLKTECSLIVKGKLTEESKAPGGYELQGTSLEIVHIGEDFLIQKDYSKEFLADVRHLWLRSRKMTAIMKIRHTILQSFREYYSNQGYFEFSPPILQPTQSEGGATLFEVKYYEDKLYLTQSAQLYSESYIMGLEKIFLISPCFRAEKSKTSRHLSEFWMAEMEAAWMDLDGLQDDIEGLIKYIVKNVVEKNMEELKILERDISKLTPIIEKPFKRMTYTEVLDLLKKEGIETSWGKDLRTVEEEKLSDHFDVPVLVTRYPKDIMAFYKPKDPKDSKVALCLDVIAPEHYGEIFGGSQRDLDIKEMSDLLEKDGEDPKNYGWYFDSRKYGAIPHSGHGMGVERVVAWICGLDNIKDAIPFPRTMERFKP